jgi:hypothetical protein
MNPQAAATPAVPADAVGDGTTYENLSTKTPAPARTP